MIEILEKSMLKMDFLIGAVRYIIEGLILLLVAVLILLIFNNNDSDNTQQFCYFRNF